MQFFYISCKYQSDYSTALRIYLLEKCKKTGNPLRIPSLKTLRDI
ncbi:hypothetical protein BRYFOR_08490 [Marvinbryantia formatexigens DSM 14469]|uniref:Uncharacterized protein n=1 Tax=Marvinbryantia formatexigens DSM 14469 TaxID=478749 RepID=C6LID6_9FIRM|nr:hypothetical protein BRYFOR_08490 [Marvinbryantia formatexigens DSM 14469]